MTLEEKLQNIDNPKIENTIGLLPKGKQDTMEDFFQNFVIPRLPQKSVVQAWHQLLMEYTEDLVNLSCCVRFGNNGSDKISDEGESGYYKLRRGWLTQNTEDNFEYFFADNFFSAFIYKMALDGFVPADVHEFRNIFQQHKFPYGFGFKIDNKVNEYKGVVIAIGKQPGFLDNYKLSHVFDAGESFLMDDGTVLGDAELSPQYYPIGHSDDFLKNSNKIRRMKISEEAKKVIVAKFLRFAHPLNYFLTPGKKLHTCKAKVHMKDIGEDPVMLYRVRQYLKNEYPSEYTEFLERIMWSDDYIGIQYERPGKAFKKLSKAKPSAATSKSSATTKRTPRGVNKEIVLDIMNSIVNSGKMTTVLLNDLKTSVYTKINFKLPTYPLLILETDFPSTGYERRKYYPEPIEIYGDKYFVCSQWIPERIAKLEEWYNNL